MKPPPRAPLVQSLSDYINDLYLIFGQDAEMFRADMMEFKVDDVFN
jgi:hypothetical protein